MVETNKLKEENQSKLSPSQEKYFKNSKVRDENGDLLIVYHGTSTPGFKAFNPSKAKSQFGDYKFKDYNVNYFTTNKRSAISYTNLGVEKNNNVLACYVNIENPFIVDNQTENDIKSSFNIKDKRLRNKQIQQFENFWNKYEDDYLDENDLDRINKDLYPLNCIIKPASERKDNMNYSKEEGYYDLYTLGNNSMWGSERPILYAYELTELFDSSMYDEVKEAIIGEEEDDYYLTTDDVVRYVLLMNEQDNTSYDGIIIKDIIDSKDMFDEAGTDVITLKSSNQIKLISNKNPSNSDNIDESKLMEYLKNPEPDNRTKDYLVSNNGNEVKKFLDTNISNDQAYRLIYFPNVNGEELYIIVDIFEGIHWDGMYKAAQYGYLTKEQYSLPKCMMYILPKTPSRFDEDLKDWKNIDIDIYTYSRFRLATMDIDEINFPKSNFVRILGDYENMEIVNFNEDNELNNEFEETFDFKLRPKILKESYLTEATKAQLINKSKHADSYSARNQGKGKNRYERRIYSKLSNNRSQYNKIDMDQLFKRDILTVGISVKGETDDYIVTMRFNGVLAEIRKEMTRKNAEKLSFKIISRALTRAFNNGQIQMHCNCLHPDTPIKLLDGTIPTIKEMCERFEAGEKLYVYSVDEKGDFKPGEVEKVWQTGESTEFIKVTLDNGEQIITTPNHPYMLRNGNYLFAQDLEVGQSLMPLYFNSTKEGYETVKFNSTGKYHSTYKVVANTLYSDEIEKAEKRVNIDDNMPYKVAIHHKDFNKANNNPNNLEIMTAREHWDYHSVIQIRNNHIKDVINRMVEAGVPLTDSNYDIFRQRKCEPTLAKVNQAFGDFNTALAQLGYNDKFNHRVVKIERITLPSTPVYDIKVKTYENFLVNAGVILHNCPDATYRQNYWQWKDGNGTQYEPRPSNKTNPRNTKGAGCKHTMLVLSNLDWIMKISSVINNYVKYSMEHLQNLYATYIFPKIYGMPYQKAVQLSLFDNGMLPQDQQTLTNVINWDKKNRNEKGQFISGNQYQFQKDPNKSDSDKPNPGQLSIFQKTPKTIKLTQQDNDEDETSLN